jgi:hypothetical protein
MRILTVLAAAFLLAVALSGCMRAYEAPPTTTTPTHSVSIGPPRAGYANHIGNWSLLPPGTFQLYKTTTHVENYRDGQWIGRDGPCPSGASPPPLWFYNATRGLLHLDRQYALHPSDPGPLTAVWIKEEIFRSNCRNTGFYGINEDPMVRTLPLAPTILTQQGTFLWLNVTFHQDTADPPSHRVTIHDQTFGPDAGGNITYEAANPAHAEERVRARVALEYLGNLSYDAVRRY